MRWLRWICTICVVGATFLVTPDRVEAGAIPLGANARVTDSSLNGSTISHARVVEHNGVVYAVWEDGRDANHSSVYFAKSTNGGESWGPNIPVSAYPDDDWVNHPDIAVQADGTIWVIWHQFYTTGSNKTNDLRLARSTDGGATWSIQNLANGNDSESDLWRARIVVDPSTDALYVMTQVLSASGEIGGMEMLLLHPDPANDTWAMTTINDAPVAGRIGEDFLDYGAWFSLQAANGVLCAVWEDRGRTVDERQPIYGACSTDGGATFGPNFRVSEDDGIRPEIALGPAGEIYVVYAIDTDADKLIKMRLSTDSGATWSETRTIATVESDKLRDWQAEVDANGQLVVVFVQEYITTSDLWLATSIDQGQNFALQILQDLQGQFGDSAEQYQPALAVGGTGDDTRAYVVWEDDRNSDHEMWSVLLILDSLPPTVPTAVTITPEASALRLTWQPSTDTTGIPGYHVYRATSVDGPFTQLTTRRVSDTFFVDVELDQSTYFYQVAAVDNTGNVGPRSAPISGAALPAGEPTFSGKLAYESGNGVRIRNLMGDPTERTITEASQPLFSMDGASIYYRTPTSIDRQPVAGTEPEIYFVNSDVGAFDLADNESHYAALITRQFASPGSVSGFCQVSEPHYGRPGQNLYVEQYEYASEITISQDRKWLLYTTEGFCNVAATGVYFPQRLCFVDLTSVTNVERCEGTFEYESLDFAPTGHTLAFSVDYSGQEEIWKADVQPDGTLANFVQLSRGPANQPSRAPSWSTDGNWITFQRDIDPGETEDWRLYVVRSDGVGLRSLELAGENPAMLGGGEVPDPTDPTTPVGDATLFLPTLSR